MTLETQARKLGRRVVPLSIRETLRRDIFTRTHSLKTSHARLRAARLWYRQRVLRRKALLPHLDIQVADNCNLACRACSHFSPLSPPALGNPEVFDREITRLAALFDNIEELNLVGGEPLLHPQLLDFARSARREFPAAGLVVITNGLLLRKMPEEFWGELASLRVQLRVSVYPVRLDTEAITESAARHRVDVAFTPIGSFRKLPIRQQGGCDPDRAFRGCGMCPILRDGRIYPCSYTALTGILERRFGDTPPVENSDSVSIYEASDGYRILEVLMHPVGWCRHCDVDAMETFAWSPSKRVREEWT